MKSFQSQTHYEVLEVSVGASQSEIRGAHERLTHLYADDQAALYGLVDPAYAAALRVRLNEALEILADDELREIYDEEIGLPPRVFKALLPLPAGERVGERADVSSGTAPAPAPALSPPRPVTLAPPVSIAPPASAPRPPPVLSVAPAAAAASAPPASAPPALSVVAAAAPPPASAPAAASAPPELSVPAVAPAPASAPPALRVAAAVAPAVDSAPAAPSAASAPAPSAPPEAAPAPSAPRDDRAPHPNPLPASQGEGEQRRVAPSVAVASAGTGWGGLISWVTPTATSQLAPQPAAYTYAVVPPKVFAQPAPVIVVPVPARVLAVAPPPSSAPAPIAAAPTPPPEPVAPEPSQLALDVSPGVPSWGAKVIEKATEPEIVDSPAAVEAALARIPLTPTGESEEVAPEPEAPPIPVLSDDVEVAIVPARPPANREFRAEQRPRPYEIPEGVEINGDLLKQVRMAKGLSLVQVADRTRIGVKHLENVEGDRYDALPAAVYLRGILMNLARELGLDGLRVSRSYLTFVEAHRSKG